MTDLETPKKILAPGLEVINMTKRFGSLVALDNVSMKLRPGTFHALLGGNGAGKSTLVKCIMGYYQPDEGEMSIDNRQVFIKNPREARELGIGMVYQHFTLVPNMTVAENMVLSRGKLPAIIDWEKEYADLRAYMKTTPFFIPIGKPVRALSAGEKQKLEICKQLYLKNRILFLDEPTSVLTPQEADEVLTMIRSLVSQGQISALMITHKFREVTKFADEVTVLRSGKFAGKGMVTDLTPHQMAEMMIGPGKTIRKTERGTSNRGEPYLHLNGIHALDETGVKALEDLNLSVHAGEIVGIAGVSGNGQSELIEVLAGQRPIEQGEVRVHGETYRPIRAHINKHSMYCLPEEPLRNTCVGDMSVAQNMAFRTYDSKHFTVGRFFLHAGSIRKAARDLIARYRVKTPSPNTPIRNLSGGNVQRAVLARELSGTVEVLVVANPCFGLDFEAAADIRAQIIEARNRGAAVLLVSEDLDEVLELSDRIVVMFDGQFVYETISEEADIGIIGRHMAGHAHDTAETIQT
ncbi:MAG TPA: ABC transporter ATP-binding protein [Tepidisphaeraceae bacterium]|nr:ABC transporter ATP-binding protein [Tepidisphaeraceae bacterium]